MNINNICRHINEPNENKKFRMEGILIELLFILVFFCLLLIYLYYNYDYY